MGGRRRRRGRGREVGDMARLRGRQAESASQEKPRAWRNVFVGSKVKDSTRVLCPE